MGQTKEKAAGVLRAPEAAIQKANRAIIKRRPDPVNLTMLQAMQLAGLAPAKPLELVPDGKLRRYRVEGDKDQARALIHGMPMEEWKAKHQSEATPEQLARMEASLALNQGMH